MASSFRKEAPFVAPRALKIAFDQFEADLRSGELRKAGRRIRLQAQPFQLLGMLLEHAGEVVTHEEVCRRLWPGDTFVDFDHSLAAAVNKIREALGDSAENPRYVETLPRRGYRFIGRIRGEQAVLVVAPTLPAEKADEVASEPAARVSQATWPRTLTWILLGVAATFVVSLAWGKWRLHGEGSSLKVVPFTSYPGQETAPTFSPDGTRIAFAWNGGEDASGKRNTGGYQLYVKAIGSETRLRLTNHPSEWLNAAWSPDGTQIAIHRGGGTEPGIYVVPALGGPERKLRETHLPYSIAAAISWSPDSKWIAYDDIVNGEPGDRMFLLQVETLESHQFLHDPSCVHEADLTFSNGGKQLAWVCVHNTASFEVMISDPKGETSRSLGSFPSFIVGLAWEADDQSLIVSQSSEGPDQLVQVGLSDGKRQTLSLLPAGVWPAVSRTGDKLAFSTSDSRSTAWRKDLTHPATAAEQILPSTRQQDDAKYSPDGKHIVFDSSRTGIWSVWLADPDGSNLVQISHGGAAGSPQWSPDSQEIVYMMREPDGRFGIYVANIADRVPRKLRTNVREMTHPSWSNDEKWIYFRGFEAIGHKLYRCPAAGGDATVIAAGLDAVAPRESYDGKVLYFATRQLNMKLKMISLSADGSRQDEFVEGMPDVLADGLWTVTPKGIYFVATTAPRTLSYFDFATRRTRELFKVEKEFGNGLSVSPDGRYLLYALQDELNSEIMLVEKFR